MSRPNTVASMIMRAISEYEPSFKHYQMVVLRDKSLSYIHGFLLVSVIIYEVIYITVLYHQYALFENPIGNANFYDGPTLAGATPISKTPYCSNDSYTWGFDLSEESKVRAGGFAFNLSGPCVPFSRSKHIQMGTNIFSVVTQESIIYENGTVEQHLIHAPEYAVLNVIHVVSASFFPASIVNPPSVIHGKDGGVFRSFDDAGPISLSVQDCLDIAGITLDSRCFPSLLHPPPPRHNSPRPTAAATSRPGSPHRRSSRSSAPRA
jgi:hypothetical protein